MGKNSADHLEHRSTRCAKCNEPFKYKYKVVFSEKENLIISLDCPFCKARLHVDLNLYPRKPIPVYKSPDGKEVKGEYFVIELPDELPTTLEE